MKAALAGVAAVCVVAACPGKAALARSTAVWRLRVLVTAYAPGCGDSGGLTASGTDPGPGTVAVDPRVIRLGSRLFVPGYGPARALDTGGAIYGARLDVWMRSCSSARRWGSRTVTAAVWG